MKLLHPSGPPVGSGCEPVTCEDGARAPCPPVLARVRAASPRNFTQTPHGFRGHVPCALPGVHKCLRSSFAHRERLPSRPGRGELPRARTCRSPRGGPFWEAAEILPALVGTSARPWVCLGKEKLSSLLRLALLVAALSLLPIEAVAARRVAGVNRVLRTTATLVHY